MKTKKIIVAAMASMAGVILSSCQSKEHKLEKAQENVVDANEDLRKAQREFREEQENVLTENERDIERYRVNIKDSKEELRADMERRIDSLQQKNKELRVRLNEDYDNNERWESFKREFNHDMERLKESLRTVGKDNVK
jgi:peptidoglycan hydrolase CwlO-like protein